MQLRPWVGRTPQRRKRQPTPVALLGESHGQRRLAGSSLNGRKELDTAEGLDMTQPTARREGKHAGKWVLGLKTLALKQVLYLAPRPEGGSQLWAAPSFPRMLLPTGVHPSWSRRDWDKLPTRRPQPGCSPEETAHLCIHPATTGATAVYFLILDHMEGERENAVHTYGSTSGTEKPRPSEVGGDPGRTRLERLLA